MFIEIEEIKLFPIIIINVGQNYKLFDLKTNSVISQILHEFEGNFTKLEDYMWLCTQGGEQEYRIRIIIVKGYAHWDLQRKRVGM